MDPDLPQQYDRSRRYSIEVARPMVDSRSGGQQLDSCGHVMHRDPERGAGSWNRERRYRDAEWEGGDRFGGERRRSDRLYDRDDERRWYDRESERRHRYFDRERDYYGDRIPYERGRPVRDRSPYHDRYAALLSTQRHRRATDWDPISPSLSTTQTPSLLLAPAAPIRPARLVPRENGD